MGQEGAWKAWVEGSWSFGQAEAWDDLERFGKAREDLGKLGKETFE